MFFFLEKQKNRYQHINICLFCRCDYWFKVRDVDVNIELKLELEV